MEEKRFHSNYASKDDADTTIEKLQSKGLNAEIGPMKPIIDTKTERISHKQPEGYVGVYFVEGKEHLLIPRNRR